MTKSVWAIIPARGGSKSIPKKNLVPLGRKPLIEYVITSASKSESVQRIICSTDDRVIADHCQSAGIEVHDRPKYLATSTARVDDVLLHILKKSTKEKIKLPEAIVLLQPTSPFVLPDHIDSSVERLLRRKNCNSVQTVIDCPHNMHAFNQRSMIGSTIHFRFRDERQLCYNKQKKPHHYLFGNLVVTRVSALLEGHGVFAEPSSGLVIPPIFGFDLDKLEDIAWGEYCIEKNLV
jgi:CMP-N-acetylneuraminic acid synthetase